MANQKIRRHEKSVGSVIEIYLEDNYSMVESVFKALASERRLQILSYLTNRNSSVIEIAAALDMPNSTATMHINILAKAGLVRTELTPASRGLQKVCYRICDRLLIHMPMLATTNKNVIDIEMPIGAYVDCKVSPTCGLAGESGVIGEFDDPKHFYDPERIYAQLLWFRAGYVEYRFPKRLPHQVILESLQVSLEIGSEAPLHSDDWPSDIMMWINGVEIGTWTSPADFADMRGVLTPDWWEEWSSQYGLLKMWKVTPQGSFIDGMQVSDVTLDEIKIANNEFITVRIGVKSDAVNVGGLNIFGKQFGNYPQDILMRLTYLPNGAKE
jgi:predicted transcriptional regulator